MSCHQLYQIWDINKKTLSYHFVIFSCILHLHVFRYCIQNSTHEISIFFKLQDALIYHTRGELSCLNSALSWHCCCKKKHSATDGVFREASVYYHASSIQTWKRLLTTRLLGEAGQKIPMSSRIWWVRRVEILYVQEKHTYCQYFYFIFYSEEF